MPSSTDAACTCGCSSKRNQTRHHSRTHLLSHPPMWLIRYTMLFHPHSLTGWQTPQDWSRCQRPSRARGHRMGSGLGCTHLCTPHMALSMWSALAHQHLRWCTIRDYKERPPATDRSPHGHVRDGPLPLQSLIWATNNKSPLQGRGGGGGDANAVIQLEKRIRKCNPVRGGIEISIVELCIRQGCPTVQ